MAKKVVKTAKAVVKKTVKPRKKVVVKEIDPKIRKAVIRRYGKQSSARRGGRYSTPAEIAENPAAWDGDVSDMLEEVDNGE